jgi:hypothetical protein
MCTRRLRIDFVKQHVVLDGETAMRKFSGIACSAILALAIADVGAGKVPVEGVSVAQYYGKGKAPIGKGKAPPPPVVTKG